MPSDEIKTTLRPKIQIDEFTTPIPGTDRMARVMQIQAAMPLPEDSNRAYEQAADRAMRRAVNEMLTTLMAAKFGVRG